MSVSSVILDVSRGFLSVVVLFSTSLGKCSHGFVPIRLTPSSPCGIGMPSQVHSRSLLSWKESCWSKEEVSATSRWKGVCFTCDLCFLVAGLKLAPGKVGDSYAAIDFGFYCMEHGRTARWRI
ncbi:unnamed protein product [Prorocentrum cordatum]|uniref:Secreted protein n=1 Tax=Prorocentrum cordatum TaxID=2364126 RepID=A0ABN9WXM3_9DINO|nr:unnamed protein product [Polarella glacialis]